MQENLFADVESVAQMVMKYNNIVESLSESEVSISVIPYYWMDFCKKLFVVLLQSV